VLVLYWRTTRAECQRGFGEGNKQAFKAIVEAYPLRTEITKMLPYERYMGIQSTFERVGFEPVAQRSERRLIVRYHIR